MERSARPDPSLAWNAKCCRVVLGTVELEGAGVAFTCAEGFSLERNLDLLSPRITKNVLVVLEKQVIELTTRSIE